MKVSYFLGLLLITFWSCGQQQENNLTSYPNTQDDKSLFVENNTRQQVTKKSLKAYKIKAQRHNMLFGIMPIPSSWEEKKNNKENILFEGPNGEQIYNESYKKYFYSNNQELNYYAQQNGTEIQPVKSINQVIDEMFIPQMKKMNINYAGRFPLPQMAQSDQNFDNALFKSFPEQKRYDCVVAEWENDKGEKAAWIVRYFVTQYPTTGGVEWGFTINSIVTPTKVFEQTKKDYINALINFKYNPNWIKANNAYFMQLSKQSTIAHNQRMQANAAQARANTNISNIYSSITDSNHESWKRRNAMTDAGQANAVDGVWERSNMYDQSGNQYQVEGYQNNVWVNNNDQFIATDDMNWNPNVDQATYFTEWEQLQYSDDN